MGERRREGGGGVYCLLIAMIIRFSSPGSKSLVETLRYIPHESCSMSSCSGIFSGKYVLFLAAPLIALAKRRIARNWDHEFESGKSVIPLNSDFPQQSRTKSTMGPNNITKSEIWLFDFKA